MNEVGEQDIWQRAELGAAVVSSDRAKALELIDDVVRAAIDAGADVISVAKDVVTFDGQSQAIAVDDRTGAGDKAAAADDFIPEEWKQS